MYKLCIVGRLDLHSLVQVFNTYSHYSRYLLHDLSKIQCAKVLQRLKTNVKHSMCEKLKSDLQTCSLIRIGIMTNAQTLNFAINFLIVWNNLFNHKF